MVVIQKLYVCVLLCLSGWSLANGQYPPGQDKALWKWIGTEKPAVSSFFRLPDKRGVCLYHQAITDQWFSGTVEEICQVENDNDGQCLSSRIECHYLSDHRTVVLRESFWILKALSPLYLSNPENIYGQYRLKFPFADGQRGLCVIHDQKSSRSLSGWVMAGEKLCKAGEVESERYQQFQLIQPEFWSELKFLLLIVGGLMVAGTVGIVFYVIAIETMGGLLITLPDYLYYILMVSARSS